MTDDRIPLEQALPGMQMHPLPNGWMPVEAFLLVKSMDEAGVSTWSYRTSNPLNREELLGVLTVQRRILLDELAAEFGDEQEDED
jgi:hypothetical protein